MAFAFTFILVQTSRVLSKVGEGTIGLTLKITWKQSYYIRTLDHMVASYYKQQSLNQAAILKHNSQDLRGKQIAVLILN